MTKFDDVLVTLRSKPAVWLVTGAAGFIGSNLVEKLLKEGQKVVGLDNFATGYQHNFDAVKKIVGEAAWKNFTFLKGSIVDPKICAQACNGVDYVLHQAALGSVPRSIEDPVASHEANVDGFVQMVVAARDAKVKRFVYASSSAVYGDSPELPKKEEKIGNSISPYATTKHVNELYAGVFNTVYGLKCVGLRYFNVFGPRQDPNGAYAAVVPKWIDAAFNGKACSINGDGETSRDFCHIDNVVQANILGAVAPDSVNHEVFNVAVGARTTLGQLHDYIWDAVVASGRVPEKVPAVMLPFRAGDIRHSLADTTKIGKILGYVPQVQLGEGISRLVQYLSQ